MREGWKEVTIGQLGKVITGNTPPKKDSANYGGVYPFIKPTDMEIDSRHVNVWEENYSEKAYKRYKNSFIPPRSTGVVTIGTVGEKLFQADRWCFTNQSVNVVIPNEKLYDPDFIYYLLKINLPKVENANPGTASGRHHVSKSNFCAIKVKLPTNINTQRKIAKILSNYDDLIENNLKRIKILEEMAQQTYEEWFVRMRFPGYETTTINETTGLPEGWERVKLGEVCNFSQGLQVPIEKQFTQFSNELIRFIRIVDVTQNTNDIRYIESPKSLNQFVHFKDVFMVRYGAPQVVTNYHGIIANNFFRININDENKLKRKFLFSFLNRNEIKENLLAMSVSATMPAISFKSFSTLDIILPEIEVQAKFHKYVDTTYDLILNLQNQNQRLREARDILLPRLMMGMVEV